MKHLNLLLISCVLYFWSCTSDEQKQLIADKNVFYDKAYEYNKNGKPSSAFLYFNKAKDLFLQKKDSLGVAKCLLNMAIISTDKGDYFGSQEFSLNSISYLNKQNKDHQIYIVSNLNNLGVTFSALENYSQAISFYKQSLDYAKDTASLITIENNIAYAYTENGDYETSIALYNAILNKGIKDRNQYAKILSNKVAAKWLQNPNYNAVPDLLKALQIRLEENDLTGIHSSYGYLSDYYAHKQPDSALFYAIKMYNVVEKINNADDKLIALQKLVKLSKPEDTKRYFLSYQNLSDSIQTDRRAAKNQFAVIRYETEKHKADNLVLQKENTAKKYQLAILLLGAISLVITSVFWYRKRKQKLDLEAQNTIRENQLNTSKKVHDRVANKIYSVISEIENRRELDRENLLDKLDHIYHTSRDISYEITDSQQSKKFGQQLSDMFYTYVADPPNVKITGNDDGIWTDVANNHKGEVFIVLQELMTNMKKHSQATEVTIQFHKKDQIISIYYHDNGIGLPKNVIHNNGLKNTETRIKNIFGTITFETLENKGLEILISFPVN